MQRPTRALRLIADLARVNRRYLASSSFRRATMQTLALPSDPLELSPASVRERAVAPASAGPYAGLSGASLALSCVKPHTSASPVVTLVLSELDPERIFAGVNTAIRAAGMLAGGLERPLRVLILSELTTEHDRVRILDAVASRLPAPAIPVSVALRDEAIGLPVHHDDVWVVTHWTTAHPALVAHRAGVIDARRVVYLVQDYEPGFVAASTDSVTAQSTYHEAFHLLVNSTPVARVLRSREKIDVDDALVFAPEIDITTGVKNEAAASFGQPTQRVFFYGRPSKPRNLFALGVAALRVAASQVPPDAVDWVSAGEHHPDIDLADGHTLRSAGTLSWADYFALLCSSDVALSLQATPHPSHPPLEAVARGAVSVTNDVDGARQSLHPRIIAAPGDPASLGAAVLAALRTDHAVMLERSDVASLGVPLKTAVDSVINRLDRQL